MSASTSQVQQGLYSSVGKFGTFRELTSTFLKYCNPFKNSDVNVLDDLISIGISS